MTTTSDSEPLSRRRLPRALFIMLCCLAALFLLTYSWHALRQSANSPAFVVAPVLVPAIVVKGESLPQTLDAIGSLEAVEQVMLSSEIAGRIVAIYFSSGSQVRAGTALAQLYDAPDRADRAVALSRARFSQLQYRRSQELVPIGAEASQMLDQHEAEWAQAKSTVAQIDARLVQKVIRAPFSGQLGLRKINLGQYVQAGDPVATLTNLDALYVNFTVPQQSLALLQPGQTVEVRSDAFPTRHFIARLVAIEPVVGSDTRNVSVQALVPNTDHALRPGLFVSVGVVQPSAPRSILLPDTAIQTSASGDSVLVVRGAKPLEEGVAQAVAVKTGRKVGDRIVIERGLHPGDVVIPYGQVRVQAGAAVKIAHASFRP